MTPNDKINGAVPTLRYFDSKGLAEGIRMLFEDQGIKYEDIRYTTEEWPTVKKQLVESGENPSGQVPVVTVNKQTLTQSLAIFRYFARIYDLYGSNNDEAYAVDHAVETVVDTRRDSTVLWGKDEEAKAEFWKNKAPVQLELLNKLVRARGGPYVLGDKISFVDFMIHQVVFRYQPNFPEFSTQYKGLDTHYKAINARPNVAAYLASTRVPAK